MKKWGMFGLLLLAISGTIWAQDTQLAQWEENLEVLLTELPQRHVNPFTKISEADFLAAAETLQADLPTLNDAQRLIRTAALVTMLGDAHTVLIWNLTQPIYPLSLLTFEDGLYVVAAPGDYAAAIGARLVSINDQPIETVIEQMQTILPHENSSWLNVQVPNFVIRSEVLVGLGLLAQNEPCFWEFENAAGEIVRLEIVPVDPTTIHQLPFQFARTAQPPTENTRGNYWLQSLDDGTLYLKYNRAIEAADLPMSRFIEIVLNALEEQSFDRLVIDLRSNMGGNSMLLDPLITALTTHEMNEEGKLFVIIGGATYSSGLLNALRLAQETEAVLIGQPTGGAPNHFGEVQQLQLPHFGLTLQYSTNYFEMLPDEAGETLNPDILIPLTFADYQAGIDPFYAAVLEYTP